MKFNVAVTQLNCEQSLIFLYKVTVRETYKARERQSRERPARKEGVALDEIRTRRILREKADCKQSMTKQSIKQWCKKMY